MKAIIHKTPSGSICVTHAIEPTKPGETESQYLDRVRAHAETSPALEGAQFIGYHEVSSLPANRNFRDAWDISAEGKVHECPAKKSKIQWDRVRITRDICLKASDEKIVRLMERDDPKLAEYKAYRQALRDIPQAQEDPFNVQWPQEPK